MADGSPEFCTMYGSVVSFLGFATAVGKVEEEVVGKSFVVVAGDHIGTQVVVIGRDPSGKFWSLRDITGALWQVQAGEMAFGEYDEGV